MEIAAGVEVGDESMILKEFIQFESRAKAKARAKHTEGCCSCGSPGHFAHAPTHKKLARAKAKDSKEYADLWRHGRIPRGSARRANKRKQKAY